MGRVRSRKLIQFATASALAISTAALLFSQQSPIFRVDVHLVRLLVTVKNAEGQLVGSLTKDDFKIIDSGVPQTIATFEHHTAQPLSICLLVDTSATVARKLQYELEASARFLNALTREGNPEDALAFYTFNQDVTLQSSFTRNPARIERTFKELRATAGTSIYDAIYLSTQPLANREGRHVVVLVSDGSDTTSATSYDDALRSLHESEAILYSLIVVPVAGEAGRNTGGEHALIQLSRSTGGKYFFPAADKSLDDAFDEVLRELRTQYLITYYPKNLPESKSKFRLVKLELKDPGLQASTQSGYYEK